MISGEGLLSLLIQVIVGGMIFGLLWWLLDVVALREPFAKFARVILVLAAVVFLVNILLGFTGHPLIYWGGGK